MLKKELQCDLCRIETVIDEIAAGKTDYSNVEVARLCSEHTLAVMAYMNFGVWHTLHLSHYESAKFWIHYLFNKE